MKNNKFKKKGNRIINRNPVQAKLIPLFGIMRFFFKDLYKKLTLDFKHKDIKKYIAGIDISKEKPDLCFTQEEKTLKEEETVNTTAAVRQALKTFLKEAGKEISEIPICAEYTGQYIWPLCCACKESGIELWLENPAQIKHSSGLQQGKNDQLDARKIAAYGFRFQDKARLYNLPQENITSLQQLTSERDMYVADKSKYQGLLTGQERFMRKQDYR
ncbi:Transposase [Bacteroidales bacterium Barb6XT]|nr:Transposase [Bacteroidales bacterium Barb6XT]